MPRTTTTPKIAPMALVAPDRWVTEVPEGLVLIHNVLTDECAKSLAAYLNDQQLKPRFPYAPQAINYWHSGKYDSNKAGQAKLAEDHPPIYAASNQVQACIQARNIDNIPNIANWVPGSFPLHFHKSKWGVGDHYDNAVPEDVGIVGMLTLLKPDGNADAPDRTFTFTDPVVGRTFTVKTPHNSLVLFGGKAYDFWKHQSDKKPHKDIFSLTMRKANICGSGVPANTDNEYGYRVGADAAILVAHSRYRKLFKDDLALLAKRKERLAEPEEEPAVEEPPPKKRKAKAAAKPAAVDSDA